MPNARKWSPTVAKKFAMIDLTQVFTRQVVSSLREPSRHQENSATLTVYVRISVDNDVLVDTTYQVFDPPALPGIDDNEFPF